MKIVIGEPYIKEYENTTRLEALIIGPDFEKVAYFEVDKGYGKYLCFERSDAFVTSLFYFAVVNGYDMECRIPMSEKLYYKLTRVLIPTLASSDSTLFHKIKIIAELNGEPIRNEKAVGAAASGGVDSFYSIITNMNKKTTNHNLTHLLVANSYNMYRGDEDTRRRFKDTAAHAQKIADELQLPLVKIYTNISEFWYRRYQNLYSVRCISYVYALQKLFSVYYYSSAYSYSAFELPPLGYADEYWDALTIPQLSNENIEFLLSGAEVGRAEKIFEIADDPVVQKYLQVCNLHQENCSICGKCIRTQFNLYLYNKLECFDKVFKLDEFYKQKDKEIIRMMSMRSPFDKDNLSILEKNNIPVSLKVRTIGEIGHLYYVLRKMLKKVPFLFELYTKIKRPDSDEEIGIIEKYNADKEFAKSCDSGII